MDSILKANNVTVCYRIGDSQSIGVKEYILRKLTGKYQVREFTAVKNVSFSLERGSLLGIIGINGSGKSTLLKAISGIMTPTQGNVECHGKIAALLELGSGFDGDLTVRENTMLRGALLGYSREYISSVYQSIIDVYPHTSPVLLYQATKHLYTIREPALWNAKLILLLLHY